MKPRPTKRLNELQQIARPASEALTSVDLGAARGTRHSFARTLLRKAAAERWAVTREEFDIDDQGRGTAIYRVDYGQSEPVRLVAFPTVIDESHRTDRVVAEAWDMTAALCRGPVDEARIESMRHEVPGQERGRADQGTLVWTRANRSARFFDHVAQRLARGLQPDPMVMGDGGYVMRSTAFYGNGKWGLVDFDGLGEADTLGLPYRAQMLTAWLVRELSLDLVQHVAEALDPNAVALNSQWRRYLGLGNATGLGMVPYVINHPQVFDAWVASRELPLANAVSSAWSSESPEAARVLFLLERWAQHFSERQELPTEPYLSGPALHTSLLPLIDFTQSFIDQSDVEEDRAVSLAAPLHAMAAAAGVEVRAVVDSVLVEVDTSLDADIESLLRCDERSGLDLSMPCGEVRTLLDRSYGWVGMFNFDDAAESSKFWFSSADNQEPRRGRRGVDPGESVEHAIDVARKVTVLATLLATVTADTRVVEFLLTHPAQRWAVDRVVAGSKLFYGEAHSNPLGASYLPLDLQRFQLAAYGMENFSPQSTDWVRVTLFSGAPVAGDVANGIDDDWSFAVKPKDTDG